MRLISSSKPEAALKRSDPTRGWKTTKEIVGKSPARSTAVVGNGQGGRICVFFFIASLPSHILTVSGISNQGQRSVNGYEEGTLLLSPGSRAVHGVRCPRAFRLRRCGHSTRTVVCLRAALFWGGLWLLLNPKGNIVVLTGTI